MAKTKESARQLTDAAAATIAAPKVDELTKADPFKRPKGTKPDGFTGDKPGFFRGARVRR
jgi:hypothetical protein